MVYPLFIVLIAISLFAFQYVAELLSDAPRSLSLETQYLLNLPACIFVGIVDFLIIVIVLRSWTTLTIQ